MSWEQNLSIQPASIDGLGIDVVSTNDQWQNSNANHAYPYRDGEIIEPMGRGARRISLQIVLWQEDYEERLKAVLEVVSKRGEIELVHPIYGTLSVIVQSFGTPFDASEPDYTLMPVEVLEQGLDKPLFGEQGGYGMCDASYDNIASSLEASESTFADTVAGLAGQIKSANAAMNDAMDTMRKEVLSVVGQPLKTLDLAIAGLDYALAPAQFVQDLWGGFTARINALRGRVKVVSNMPQGLYNYFSRSLGSGTTAASYTTPNVAAWVEVRDNTRKALLGETYRDSDNVERKYHPAVIVQVRLVQALALAEVATDYLQDELETKESKDFMTPLELQALVADVRADLMTAMSAYRALYTDITKSRPVTEALKRQAVALQELAERIINLRPPLIVREVPKECNLRLLAHWWYGDDERSLELLRLNPQVRYPNYLQPGTFIYGYAK